MCETAACKIRIHLCHIYGILTYNYIYGISCNHSNGLHEVGTFAAVSLCHGSKIQMGGIKSNHRLRRRSDWSQMRLSIHRANAHTHTHTHTHARARAHRERAESSRHRPSAAGRVPQSCDKQDKRASLWRVHCVLRSFSPSRLSSVPNIPYAWLASKMTTTGNFSRAIVLPSPPRSALTRQCAIRTSA